MVLKFGIVLPAARDVITRSRSDLSGTVRDKAIIWTHTKILGTIGIWVE